MNKVIHDLKNNLWPLIIILFVLVIARLNYKPGTWLTGWDNLHPEFNFYLNFKRSIFSVWQEYQGLGLLGGMAHSADLPRQIILFILSIIFPTAFLRYFSTFILLVLGPLGVFYLLKYLLLPQNKEKICFIGALFYFLNLATVQIFYTPYEAFIVHYAFLPWLVLVLIKYLDRPCRKNLFLLFLTNLIALPQAYVPTTFFVYLITLAFVYVGKVSSFKSFLKGLLVIFLLNAFWLLPFVYFSLINIQKPLQAHNNFMQTEDIYLKNKKFGNFGNTALLRNFWFDYVELKDDKYQYLIGGWRLHLKQPIILGIGYSLFGLVLLGFISLVGKKPKYWLSMSLLFVFSFAMLTNDQLPFSWFDHWWRKIPVISQVLRVPFTKFAVLACLTYSLLFSFGVWQVLSWFKKILNKREKIISYALTIGLAGVLLIYCWPVLQGNFFDQTLRLDLPQEYFQLMNFLQTQDKNTRIINLPQSTFWGWSYYNWGYHGSGFIWYGISQPILDRAFDVWSNNNENYYWEVSQAIYSQNLPLLENILEKYQINWVIFDENIRGNIEYKALYFPEIGSLLSKSEKIKLVKEFGKIKVYQVNLTTPVKDFVFLAQNLPQVNSYSWNNDDTAFTDLGHYVSSTFQLPPSTSTFHLPSSTFQVIYPFRSLFTGRKQEELEFTVDDRGEEFIFSSLKPFPPAEASASAIAGRKPLNLNLDLPSLTEEETLFWTQDLRPVPLATPSVQLIPSQDRSPLDLPADATALQAGESGGQDSITEVAVPKQPSYFSYDSSADPNFSQSEPKSCDPFNTGLFSRQLIKDGEASWLHFESLGSSNCYSINLPHFSQKQGYLVKIQKRYLEGKSLMFYVIDETAKHRVIETSLPKDNQTAYFIIPPQDPYGAGYTLHFDNISIGRQKTVNELGRVEVYPIPYRFLKAIKLTTNQQPNQLSNQQLINNVSHPNPSYYQIELKTRSLSGPPGQTGFSPADQPILVLSQAYHQGWKAYTIKNYQLGIMNWLAQTFPFIFGQEIKGHVQIDNWANGWILDQSTTNTQPNQPLNQQLIILFFLPQLLEYLGFGLLFLLPIILVTIKSGNDKNRISPTHP